MYWRRFPLFVNIVAMTGLAMLLPAVHGAATGDFATGRLMLYLSIATVVFCAIVGLSLANRAEKLTAKAQLLTVVAGLILLPLLLAVPFPVLLPATTWTSAYFEMVSSLTTTGATVFSDPSSVPPSLHLWRGIVAWIGGYLSLVVAFGVMAPLDIGGFEMTGAVQGRQGEGGTYGQERHAQDRLLRVVGVVTTPYLLITGALGVALLATGTDLFSAVMLAMAVVSTSGVVASDGAFAGQGGFLAEAVIAVFLIMATTAIIYDPNRRKSVEQVKGDPELRLLVVLIAVIPALLMARHVVGAIELEDAQGAGAALVATWGAVFTVLSFVATLGHESAAWGAAQAWSGLETPSLLLLGLIAVGGGVASTAGGIKLLRVYALYKHGLREMERLTLPNSVAGAGQTQRRIRREGAFIAWVYLMLFLISLAASVLALAATGIDLIPSIELALVMISNAGPALGAIAETPIRIEDLGQGAQLILCAVMIVGRLEVLALFALIDPSFWRD